MSTKLIPIAPFGKERPRVTRNGQHTYMPPEYEQKKSQLRLLFGDVPTDGILSLTVVANKAVPKSWSNKKKSAMNGMYCNAKPDLDNIVGAVMDSLIEGDSRVVKFGECRKVWSSEDSLEITIEEIYNEDSNLFSHQEKVSGRRRSLRNNSVTRNRYRRRDNE